MIEIENPIPGELLAFMGNRPIPLGEFVEWYATNRGPLGYLRAEVTAQSARLAEAVAKRRTIQAWTHAEAKARAEADYWQRVADTEALAAQLDHLYSLEQKLRAWLPFGSSDLDGLTEDDIVAINRLQSDALDDLGWAIHDVESRLEAATQDMTFPDADAYKLEHLEALDIEIDELQGECAKNQADVTDIEPFVALIVATTS